jgi:hypothetical protein
MTSNNSSVFRANKLNILELRDTIEVPYQHPNSQISTPAGDNNRHYLRHC